MAIFGKKNEDGPPAVFAGDPRKAQRFFDHAKVVSDSRNYDYAIDCYVNGLRHDPANLPAHQSLHDVSLKRKATGGKPATLSEKFKTRGKGLVDKLLHAELLWAKDPHSVALMVDVMDRAVEADLAYEQLDLFELACWVGRTLLETGQAAKTTNKTLYVKATNLFAGLHAFAEAVDACQLALRLDPNNAALARQLKELEAERTMQKGGYTPENVQAGGFQRMVKDMDKQRQLERGDAITASGTAIDQEIRQRRLEHEQAPQDLSSLSKLAAALIRQDNDAAENEAIGLLEQAYAMTDQYAYKMRIGDIRMKQTNRRWRKLQAAAKANPDDAQIRRQAQTLLEQKLKFELDQYAQRVTQYPTDLGLRYEQGKRLFALKQYDEAIGAFQQAKVDPKHRVLSLDHLGRCYAARGWLEESVDTLEQGIQAHSSTDDRLALAMRYQLMLSLAELATKEQSIDRAKQAQKIASQVLQTDINFRDIRRQMDRIRRLTDLLAKTPPRNDGDAPR